MTLPLRAAFVAAVAVTAAALLAPGAAAQEAPICTQAKERLDDGRDVKQYGNGRQSVIGLRGRDRLAAAAAAT